MSIVTLSGRGRDSRTPAAPTHAELPPCPRPPPDGAFVTLEGPAWTGRPLPDPVPGTGFRLVLGEAASTAGSFQSRMQQNSSPSASCPAMTRTDGRTIL